MTTIAKGAKKPYHSSNIPFMTMYLFMKGQWSGGKNRELPVTKETNTLPWQPEIEFLEFIWHIWG